MVAREVREFIGIPRFPAVKIDLAIVVPKDVTAERVQQSIRSAGRKLLEGPRLFDVYRSKGAEAGTKDEAAKAHARAVSRSGS